MLANNDYKVVINDWVNLLSLYVHSHNEKKSESRETDNEYLPF